LLYPVRPASSEIVATIEAVAGERAITVRGEIVEGDVAAYHYYPGRDEAFGVCSLPRWAETVRSVSWQTTVKPRPAQGNGFARFGRFAGLLVRTFFTSVTGARRAPCAWRRRSSWARCGALALGVN